MLYSLKGWRKRWTGGEEQSGQVIVLDRCEALYFAIPKVACSSLKSLCVDVLGVNMPADSWKADLFHSSQFSHLIDTRNVVIGKTEATRFPDYWGFAFVRNPWDRLVSCYAEKIRANGDPAHFVDGLSKVLIPYGVFKAGMCFDHFARAVAEIPDREAEPHFRSQYTFLFHQRTCRPLPSFIGRFENLEVDFQHVASRLGIHRPLEHLLASQHRPYMEYYTRELVAIIGERYHQDIELFDYCFEPEPVPTTKGP